MPVSSRYALIVRLSLYLGMIFSVVACQDSDVTPSAVKRSAQPVIAAKVVYSPEMQEVQAVGTSRAFRSVSVRPRVSGQVEEVHIQPGQWVEKGQLLLELDSRNERLTLRNAEVELEDARRLLTRYQQTKDSGAVTKSTLDDAESAVARAEIAVDQASVDLQYQEIRAPFSGYVGFTDLDPGAWVDTSTVVTTLDDRSRLLVTFNLPELLLGQIQPGQAIELSAWRNDAVAVAGEIIEIDSRVDNTERTFRVRAKVDNPDDALRPGMSFRIDLTLQGNRFVLVPEISLQWGARGSYVWAVIDGKAERVIATIVQRRAGRVLVDTELEEGDLVVLEGIQKVRQGQPVEIAEVVELEVASASESDAKEVSGE
ncbi:efflux RND transporter periplasmic adaptor subunit [Gilvimarinus xylanilyticus]|uniref:Efflux RND transporter periplasmic adaptor subunit n=1 Tax=Gilvimarinus xylanilyticus TaxID=2944139 RepID=A0A9X2KTF1_9GAMM|nr:efflux RND transporter periplasmic adaptor subunit [Gilvimarinus xylanilyticus]MCP8899189.1 efflux RND transporter periplasmic adaptor subunit [Gilvimarinus xylanilyticus]